MELSRQAGVLDVASRCHVVGDVCSREAKEEDRWD